MKTVLDRADCADFGCHNSIRLETKHFLNTLALTFISFSGRFVFAMQKHYLFFCERSSSLHLFSQNYNPYCIHQFLKYAICVYLRGVLHPCTYSKTVMYFPKTWVPLIIPSFDFKVYKTHIHVSLLKCGSHYAPTFWTLNLCYLSSSLGSTLTVKFILYFSKPFAAQSFCVLCTFTCTLKLKTQSQLTQSPFTGTNCLLSPAGL